VAERRTARWHIRRDDRSSEAAWAAGALDGPSMLEKKRGGRLWLPPPRDYLAEFNSADMVRWGSPHPKMFCRRLAWSENGRAWLGSGCSHRAAASALIAAWLSMFDTALSGAGVRATGIAVVVARQRWR